MGGGRLRVGRRGVGALRQGRAQGLLHFVLLDLEEGVAERERVHAGHLRVVREFRVNVEEDWQVELQAAGKYFHKVQCFCFEEQRLLGGEELDLPVFFYIDPEFANDPQMAGVDSLTLSYTFFQVQEDEVEEALRAALAQSPHAAPAHA